MTNPREPTHTVAFVDAYCAHYRAVFTNVRHFEQFIQLELGPLAETKRKSLPRLATTAKADAQALHHFLANAAWSVDDLRAVRLDLTRQALRDRSFIHCIDETGDRKKGKTTDDAASQYIGNIHGLSNGVVSVKAYAALNTVTFPLAFRMYKPQRRLKPGDVYQSKPQLRASRNSRSNSSRSCLVPASASAWWWLTASMARVERSSVRCTGWVCGMSSPSAPIMASGSDQDSGCARRGGASSSGSSPTAAASNAASARRSTGRAGAVRYYQITTDPATLPRETTWEVMTNQPGKIERTVGNTFGLRTWVEYGFNTPRMIWAGPTTA